MVIKELEEMLESLKNIKDELDKERANTKTGEEIYEFDSYKKAHPEIKKWLKDIIESMINKRKELDTGQESSHDLNDAMAKTDAVSIDESQTNEKGGSSLTKSSSHFRSSPPNDKAA